MGVLSGLGEFAGGVAQGLETSSQIRARNANSREQEDRIRRAQEEDENSKGYMELGGQFTEGAMIPEGMDGSTYFAQLQDKRKQAAAAAEAERKANSLPGRLKGALAGIRSRDNVRQTGAAAGVTGNGVTGPTPQLEEEKAAPPPPKMVPMTARQAAEGRAMAARVFNRKDDWQKTSHDLVTETIKERANEMATLPAAEMGPAFSRYANGRKIEVIPNPHVEGEPDTFQFKMDGELLGDGRTSRSGIVQLASQFAEHDMEGAYKVLDLDAQDRRKRQADDLRMKGAQQNLETARYNLEQARKMDPLKVASAQMTYDKAVKDMDDAKFYNERRYSFLFDPERAETSISQIEQAHPDKDDRSVWGQRPRKGPDGKPMMDADGKPVLEYYSIPREEWAAQREMARTNYYRNFMKPAMSPNGVPVWQLTDANGDHVFANRSYAAVMEYAQRKWGGKPPPSVARPAAKAK